MTNVADLVQAVKVRNKKTSDLFDKVDFICRTLGTEYPGLVDTYIYEADNLRFVLNEGNKGQFSKERFKNTLVQTLDHKFFFDYFQNVSADDGRTDLYKPGDWEKDVDKYYLKGLFKRD